MNDLTLGQVVRSTAGRDRDHFMVVMSIIDDDFVMLCDGAMRKVSNPKKKKKKHLAKTNTVVENVRDKLLVGEKVQNAEVKKGLSSFNNLASIKGM